MTKRKILQTAMFVILSGWLVFLIGCKEKNEPIDFIPANFETSLSFHEAAEQLLIISINDSSKIVTVKLGKDVTLDSAAKVFFEHIGAVVKN